MLEHFEEEQRRETAQVRRKTTEVNLPSRERQRGRLLDGRSPHDSARAGLPRSAKVRRTLKTGPLEGDAQLVEDEPKRVGVLLDLGGERSPHAMARVLAGS